MKLNLWKYSRIYFWSWEFGVATGDKNSRSSTKTRQKLPGSIPTDETSVKENIFTFIPLSLRESEMFMTVPHRGNDGQKNLSTFILLSGYETLV
jgi:hypothetical protein